jgi:signal transduction histidine kinase
VATLVARAAPPDEVFAAVAAEVGRQLDVDFTILSRYDPDGTATVVGTWSRPGIANPLPPGTRMEYPDRSVHTLVFQTRQPARIDDYGHAASPGPDIARLAGVRSTVGVPIILESRLWGQIGVASRGEEPLPPDTEAWLAGFTELVATAIANAQARVELRGVAEEQAALRRVAVLVARAAPPEEVFAAVAAEAGRLLEVGFTLMGRYESDGAATIVAAWSSTGAVMAIPVGHRMSLGGRNVLSLVFETGRPGRLDSYGDAWGPAADLARQWGVRSVVGAPISVEGRLWGAIGALSTRDAPPPMNTEDRLAGFTELVATAIANAQARMELRRFAEEQAALRRVATLVARAAAPEEVFGAVASEAGRLLKVDFTVLSRYDPDGAVVVVGGWADSDPGRALAIGARLRPEGRNMHTIVFRTRRPARIDDYGDASGQPADVARDWGFRSAVGAPISVQGRLWGVISVASTREDPLPADTEARLAGFTELVGAALANAEVQAALTASRARIVSAADETRRQIERDLHDGVQQRLVSLALAQRAARTAVPPERPDLDAQLSRVADGLAGAVEEIQELSRGIHPAILARGGLAPALKTLAPRSAVPVELEVGTDARLPESVEVAAYYVVSEALTNAAKHAHASSVQVAVHLRDGMLELSIRDDGMGGADPTQGSGLIGLADRVDAIGGTIEVVSPDGEGTALFVKLPCP